VGVFGSTSSTTRAQGTIATPQQWLPKGMLVSAGLVLLLAAWGAGVWYYTIGRNTIFKPKAPAARLVPSADPGLPVAPTPATSAQALSPQAVSQPDVASFAPVATKPALPETVEPEPAPKDACDAAIAAAGIKLPADFQVLATGAYRGRDLDFRVGRNGNRASQIDVIVNSPGKPVALMLGAYDPVVWNLSWTSGTRIVAVYVGGYEPQQLVGPGANGPTLISTYEQKEKSPCPYFYLGGEGGLATVNPAARRVFGKPVDMLYPVGKDGSIFVGKGASPGSFSYRRTPTPNPEPRNPLLAEAGIDFAIKMGQLRKASAADGELWARALTQNGHVAQDLPPVVGQSQAGFAPPPDRVYIVLSREFIFPDGLYGAHSVTFVVPPGVPRPRGNPGHSAVYVVQ
jgi:hypothetical protein